MSPLPTPPKPEMTVKAGAVTISWDPCLWGITPTTFLSSPCLEGLAKSGGQPGWPPEWITAGPTPRLSRGPYPPVLSVRSPVLRGPPPPDPQPKATQSCPPPRGAIILYVRLERSIEPSPQPEQSPRATSIQFSLVLLRAKAWSFSAKSERGLGLWQEHPFSRRFLHWKPHS